MSTNDNSSSLKSYADSATGAIQSAIGGLTGNTADQTKGETRKSTAATERDLSHSVGKVGPIAATPQGGVATDSSDRTEGSWNQTIGSAKESLGGLVGADGLKAEGMQQNREGKGQEAQGQLSDLGKGVSDRVQGAVGSGVKGLVGDREGQERYRVMHDDGKAGQRSVEADLQRQA